MLAQTRLNKLITNYNGTVLKYRNNSSKGYHFTKDKIMVTIEPALIGFDRKLKNGDFKRIKNEYKVYEQNTKNCYAIMKGNYNGFKYENIQVPTGFRGNF